MIRSDGVFLGSIDVHSGTNHGVYVSGSASGNYRVKQAFGVLCISGLISTHFLFRYNF